MSGADGDGIAANPHEAGMTETHLPGKAHEQVQPECSEREHEHQRRDAIVIGGWKEQRERDHDAGHGQDWRKPVIEDAAHAHTRSTDALPNSPRGNANRTARMTRNATASLYC